MCPKEWIILTLANLSKSTLVADYLRNDFCFVNLLEYKNEGLINNYYLCLMT